MPEKIPVPLSFHPPSDMSFPEAFPDVRYSEDLHRKAPNPPGTSSTAAAYGVLLSILVYYVFQYLNHMRLPILEFVWNSAVWITPPQIVSRLDSTFKTSSVVEDPKTSNGGFSSKGHASKGDAIRRILGLDGAGVLTTVQRTRTLSNLGSVFKSKPNNSLPGLGNWDNSCYQNSILQGLAALESLPEFLEQVTDAKNCQPTKSALRGVIRKLNDPANIGKTFWTPAELKSMSSWQQQDAQEYYSKISTELEKDTAKVVNQKLGSTGLEGLPLSTVNVTRSSLRNRVPNSGSSSEVDKTESMFGRLPEELKLMIIRNPLEGLLAQRVGCQRCGYVEGLSLVPFNCLTLPLGRQWMYDIRSCLDDYTSLEPISGVECVKCTLLHAKLNLEKVLASIRARDLCKDDSDAPEARSTQEISVEERLTWVEQALEDEDFSDQALKKCQIPTKNRVSSTKTRQAVVARAPKSLVIHVNRSNFDELTGVQSKNLADVRYPQQLDLAPWCLGQGPGSEDETDSSESWNVDPSESMLSDIDLEDIGSRRPYVLRAVVTHYGRHENGHYICYRKSPYSIGNDGNIFNKCSDTWWRLSDEEVTEVDEDTVLSQGGVFMLFYEQSASLQRPPRRHVASSPEHAMENVEETIKTNEGTSTNVLEDIPSMGEIPEEPSSRSGESALPTPPPSPGKVEPDIELLHHVKTSHIVLSSNTIDATRSPPPSQSPEPTGIPVSTTPTHPASSVHPAALLESAASESNETAAEPTDAVSPTTAAKEKQPVTPSSMRTAGPRNGRGSVSRAGKAMGSVAGFVQAN